VQIVLKFFEKYDLSENFEKTIDKINKLNNEKL
jgi:hypothetical protein